MSKGKKRQPKVKPSAAAGTVPRAPRALARITNADPWLRPPVFSFALVDISGKGPCAWEVADDADEILGFLKDMSSVPWKEIRTMVGGGNAATQHKKHHDMPISSLVKAAQDVLAGDRYESLGGDIFRFRLSGEKRLWGFEFDGTFYAVWWDPNHQVYPTEPD